MYSQDEDQAHFTWENTTVSPGLAGVASKFTVKMKTRRILHEKTQRFLRGWREWQVNLQSRWRPGAFYMRKHNGFSVHFTQADFTRENTTISPGSAGRARTFHVNLQSKWKARRILHEKTQRFLRGWLEWHINVQSRWRPGAFYMRKHNSFSGVGGSGK